MSRVQLFQELGTIAGRVLFAFLVIRIATQRCLLRVFLVPGLIVFSGVYFFAATHSLRLLEYGILLAGLLLNGPFSLWGNYLPRMYPTHLRGTGESFAINIGARVIGASGVLLTTQLANIMPGAGATCLLGWHTRGVRLLPVIDRESLAPRTGTRATARLEFQRVQGPVPSAETAD